MPNSLTPKQTSSLRASIAKSVAEGLVVREQELVMLRALLADDRVVDEEREAFDQMLEWLTRNDKRSLSEKQHGWVDGRWRHLELDASSGSQNLVSRGLVPRGREVEPAAVLKQRPLKPPGRL